MKVGIIGEYEIDLINLLSHLVEHEFYYFILDSNERRKVYNIFLLPFNELEKNKKELEVILNFSDIEIKIEKVVNNIKELEKLNLLDNRPLVCRIDKVFIQNIFYFPYVIDDSLKKNSFDFFVENKKGKTALIVCEKLEMEVVGVISSIYDYFEEIYIYGIREPNTANSKKIYFLKRKIEKGELLKLLKYVDIFLDLSKKSFYYELLYAALLGKPILTVKKFRNFPYLVVDENIREKIIKTVEKNKKINYEIADNLRKNAEKIFDLELRRLEDFLTSRR